MDVSGDNDSLVEDFCLQIPNEPVNDFSRSQGNYGPLLPLQYAQPEVLAYCIIRDKLVPTIAAMNLDVLALWTQMKREL
ncbi:MAG: hypothetical protein Q9166_007276 [cf. Caloplaca sp. 2 TL-2023]